ncbi:AAA family ATPase [Bacteroides uniformis]|nr:AAA family ATPase [Bacteroides uniformis]
MATVISNLNFKGGVGKTTTTINLATALWIMGKRVLMIDTDPQCNLTNLVGFDQTENDSTIYEWITQMIALFLVYEHYKGFVLFLHTKNFGDIEIDLMKRKIGKEY